LLEIWAITVTRQRRRGLTGSNNSVYRARDNKSLDASGGSVFLDLIRPACLIEFAPPRQLNRCASLLTNNVLLAIVFASM
jgi:hypothetical protein